jgi:hypothetical protein
MNEAQTLKQSAKKPKPGKGGVCLPGPGPGRKKGVPNKLTHTAKINIEKVYIALGSIKGHVEFLKSHPKALADFYANVYPRLLPLDINQGGEVNHNVTFIMPRPNRKEPK